MVTQTRWHEAIAIEGVGSTLAAGSVTNVSATIEDNSRYCFEITLEPTGADLPLLQAVSFSDMSASTALESGIPGQEATNTALMAMPHAAAFYRVTLE